MRNDTPGTSQMAQCLRIHAPKTGSWGLIPGQGTIQVPKLSSYATTKEAACHNKDPAQSKKLILTKKDFPKSNWSDRDDKFLKIGRQV